MTEPVPGGWSHTRKILSCGRRRIYSLVSLRAAAAQIAPALLGIRPEKSATHRQSWRLAGFRRGMGVFHSQSNSEVGWANIEYR